MGKETTSIVFTGDIGFDKYMFGQWDDENLLSDEVLKFLHSVVPTIQYDFTMDISF